MSLYLLAFHIVLQASHNSVHLTVCDSAAVPGDAPLFTKYEDLTQNKSPFVHLKI